MINRSVPYRDWFDFFCGFSQRHRGEAVTVTVAGETIGVHREAHKLPLGGIVADRTGQSLSILIGGPVEEPVWVWLETDDAGNDVALEIESQNGLRTIVELAAVTVPEPA